MSKKTRKHCSVAATVHRTQVEPRGIESATGESSLVDHELFRCALGQFATGVTVVTATDRKGGLIGMTMSSFNSVSLDPALILFSVDRKAFSLSELQAADSYRVNVLANRQEDVSNRFARALENKWEGVDYELCTNGAPLLHGALAWFDCRPWAEYDGGDHLIFVGRVVDLGYCTEEEPLVFFRGKYASIDASSAREANWPLSSKWPLSIHY